MTKALYQVAKKSLEKTNCWAETVLLQYGSRLMRIIFSRSITPISYKNDVRHGLNFIMIMGMPVVVDDNYLKTLEDNNGKFRIQQSNLEAVDQEQGNVS